MSPKGRTVGVVSKGPLPRSVMLSVELSAIMSRHRYDVATEPVIDQLCELAKKRPDILAQEAGLWAGYFAGDQHVRSMVDALAQVPGADEWIEVGRYRRGIPNHAYNQPNNPRDVR